MSFGEHEKDFYGLNGVPPVSAHEPRLADLFAQRRAETGIPVGVQEGEEIVKSWLAAKLEARRKTPDARLLPNPGEGLDSFGEPHLS